MIRSSVRMSLTVTPANAIDFLKQFTRGQMRYINVSSLFREQRSETQMPLQGALA